MCRQKEREVPITISGARAGKQDEMKNEELTEQTTPVSYPNPTTPGSYHNPGTPNSFVNPGTPHSQQNPATPHSVHNPATPQSYTAPSPAPHNPRTPQSLTNPPTPHSNAGSNGIKSPIPQPLPPPNSKLNHAVFTVPKPELEIKQEPKESFTQHSMSENTMLSLSELH